MMVKRRRKIISPVPSAKISGALSLAIRGWGTSAKVILGGVVFTSIYSAKIDMGDLVPESSRPGIM